MQRVKCNRCKYVGPESTFNIGRDFFSKPYVSECPKCDNRQSPGDASMRMFGGERPFEYVRQDAPTEPLGEVLYNAGEAS